MSYKPEIKSKNWSRIVNLNTPEKREKALIDLGYYDPTMKEIKDCKNIQDVDPSKKNKKKET